MIKAEARKAAFHRRSLAHGAGTAAVAAAERLSQVLAAHRGRILAGYMAMRSEIDPQPAMAGHSGPVCVPVLAGAGVALRFRHWTRAAVMVPGEFGALVPDRGAWLEPEVLIVPLLAFDRCGHRLGYGGGFYDRTLEQLRLRRPTLAIGFAFAIQEMPDVPIEPTDQPLDMLVTEAEVLHFG